MQLLIHSIPYSRKYWWELNLVVAPKIAITRILADLNLAVWPYVHVYMRVGNLADFNLAVVV